MPKQEEPLNEVSLNAPAGKHSDLLTMVIMKSTAANGNKENMNDSESQEKEGVTKFVDGRLHQISLFLKHKSSDVDKVSQCFTVLYHFFLNGHTLTHTRSLVKQHLAFIVNLLNANNPSEALKEIVHLFNETNMIKVENLNGILLADYTVCNNYYLSTLKILSLQVILKTRSTRTHQDSLILLFSLDRRYLLKDQKLKIHTVAKLILNFFSVLPDFKVLYGLKFLQYVHQFNLNFESYIKNKSIGDFEQQLTQYSLTTNSLWQAHINSFHSEYLKQVGGYDNSSIGSLRNIYKTESMKTVGMTDLLESNFTLDEYGLVNDINAFMELAEKCLQGNEITKPNVIQKLDIVWNLIRYDGQTGVKRKIQLIDRTLIKLNSNLKSLEEMSEDLFRILKTLSEFCFDTFEIKRLTNITNILFNGFIVFKNFKYLKLAAKIESQGFLMDSEQPQKSFRRIVERFGKFISNISDLRQKMEIFSYMFNIHFMHSNESFTTLQSNCQFVYVTCHQKLKLKQWTDFECCSEVMTALFYAYSPIKKTSITTLSPMTAMLYSCISGKFFLEGVEINPESNKWHILYKFEVLLKTSYCFNLEMSKHSSSNLASITKSYIEKWISRLTFIRDKISSFEVQFLRMLMQYLEFNCFDKLLIKLVTHICSKEDYYYPLVAELGNYKMNAYIRLQMVDKVNMVKNEFASPCDLSTLKVEDLLHHLQGQLAVFSWEDDSGRFEALFTEELPKYRMDIYDIDNKSRISASSYVKILLFNVNLFMTASKLHLGKNNMIGAVTESKKALKLAISLLRKVEKLSQGSRLNLIQCLAKSYMCLIEIYIHIGVSRDCEFYVKELSRVICELGEPTAVFSCLTFLHRYYNLTEQRSLEDAALKKSNKTFDYIDGQSNILALTTFFFINNENEKIFDSLKLFFENNLEDTLLPRFWMLEVGHFIDETLCPARFKAKNSINSINKQYQKILKNIEEDPFFKNVFESLLAIPSCFLPKCDSEFNLDKHNIMGTPRKSSFTNLASPSTRPSNMTPRGKHLKQKFDRAAAINNLTQLKQSVENIDLALLKNEDLSKVSSLYSLTLTLLASLRMTPLAKGDLREAFALSELPKSLPMYYDKNLNAIGNEIYEKYTLLPFNDLLDPIFEEKQKSLQAQEHVGSLETPVNVITLDICPVTENLIISRTDSMSHRKVHLRMPLNRGYTRDLDCLNLTFKEAKDDLSKIIEESNASTAIEVTSTISSSKERKKWWEMRHDLDSKLEQLLLKMENCWFNSLKAFFSPEIVDEKLVDEFRNKLNQILHQNLPSRKQCGSPGSFIQIENWIIEWIMKLDPQDADFVSMVEDMVYFILDILLFHGEENAYDEIDFSVIHIKLEEEIRKYQAEVRSSRKLDHTFLVVSGALHIFPWECLSFFKSTSITRVPSYACLHDLLKKSGDQIFPHVSLKSGVSMILNPHGDLSRTESRFLEIFKNITTHTPGSSLVVNEKPDEESFLHKLKNSNVFIYLGHGGGEQFARLKEIKKLDSIAPSFLLGCSSAFMSDFGKLEPTGTVYTYLLGGCPLVLGNLWDVTDKDIDKFSESVFEKIGLIEKGIDTLIINEGDFKISNATGRSRDVCYLKYLNGAAPVLYGLPINFT